MTRLTKSMREMILNNAIADKFKKQQDEFEQREMDIADAIYLEVTTKEEREAVKILIKKGWLSSSHSMFVSARGYSTNLVTREPVLYNMSRLQTVKNSDALIEYLTAKNKFNETLQDTKHKLRRMLESISSVKQLREAWPEGAEYYDPVAKQYTRTPNLPTVRVEEINKLLGLPKETTK